MTFYNEDGKLNKWTMNHLNNWLNKYIPSEERNIIKKKIILFLYENPELLEQGFGWTAIKKLAEKRLKNCYIIKLSPVNIAIADLTDYFEKGMIITRINVPKEFRGKGFGRDLLNQILTDADKDGVTLYLEILASGEMSYMDLEAWYMRHGFKSWNGILRRKSHAV